MLRDDYSILDFKTERSRVGLGTRIIVLLDFYIKDVDLDRTRGPNPINNILKSYNLNVEDILLDNMIGLS